MQIKIIVLLLSATMTLLVTADAQHHAVPIPKELEAMKRLLGTWEGTNKMDGKEELVKVVYELTSGGTAITEKLMPGTPKEMISVYHKSGKSVAMTHYCAMGNQPHMNLKKSEGNSTQFEMSKPVGVSSINEPHMHAVTLTLLDPNTLKQEWVQFDNGKLKEIVSFNLTKK